MQVYEGVVQDRVVVLPKDVHLEDGLRVEIRVREQEKQASEVLFRQRLVAIGLMEKAEKPRQPVIEQLDRTPIQVEGRPLSEQIIEERR